MIRFFRFLRALIRENVPLLIFLALVVNGFLIYFIERDRRPRVVYHIERVYTATNSVSSSSVSSRQVIEKSETSSGGSKSREQSLPDFSAWYRYFEVDGLPYVFLFGQYYTVGSVTSRGVISLIFPDRILLDSGQWIVNTYNYTSPLPASYSVSTNRINAL